MNLESLKACGIDYPSALARCMGDEEIYETVLRLFLEDHTMADAEAALEQGNLKEMFNCVHTLKGISGNASMMELYAQACALTELLRSASPDEAAVRRAFGPFKACYQTVLAGVAAAVGQPIA